MTVIGTAGSDAGRKLVAEQGADHVLDHTSADYLKQAVALTNGRGIDVILEMLANVNLGKDLTVLARGGRVVVIGSRGTVEINPRDAMSRDASILGMMLFNVSEREHAAIHAALATGFKKGKLRPIVRVELPLAEAPRAHTMVMGEKGYGKIVLIP
jgi:NADPH2:quinone reductase